MNHDAGKSPEPSFFKRRRSGVDPDSGSRWYTVWVAAIIYRPCPIEMHVDAAWQWIDRWPHLVAEENGEPADVDRVWKSKNRISISKYILLRDQRAWDRAYAPESLGANPREPIDFNTLAPPRF